jgi:hypothetical protein
VKAAIGPASKPKEVVMKNITLRILAMAGLCVLAVASINAQSKREANIPFDFAAGNVRLKAGEYIIQNISTDTLLFSSAEGKVAALVLAPGRIQSTESNSTARLMFHRYGNRYFLTAVWMSESSHGVKLTESRTERRVARELARANEKPETTEILAQKK